MEDTTVIKMTRLEKCELLKSKGYTYDPDTGKVFNPKDLEIIKKHKGYTHIRSVELKSHHFAWFMTYGNVDYIELDHKNRIKTDNRISNLRISNRSQQNQNKDCRGYYWHIKQKKWVSTIGVDNKKIWIGTFNTEEEAANAYLEAKKKYHII